MSGERKTRVRARRNRGKDESEAWRRNLARKWRRKERRRRSKVGWGRMGE